MEMLSGIITYVLTHFFSFCMVYLSLGFPGLYAAVRLSGDYIDTTDREYLSTAYVLWPFMLSAVLVEYSFSLISILRRRAMLLLAATYKIYVSAIVSVVKSAELSKREKMADVITTRNVNYLENSMKRITGF
jgi:hypothetical protein